MDDVRSPLWRPAVSDIGVQMHADFYGRWHLRVQARRAGETWAVGPREEYDGLSSSEALDVLEQAIALLIQ